jgi:hypothetical protein
MVQRLLLVELENKGLDVLLQETKARLLKLMPGSNLTLISIFQKFYLYKTDSYVNKCIVNWGTLLILIKQLMDNANSGCSSKFHPPRLL